MTYLYTDAQDNVHYRTLNVGVSLVKDYVTPDSEVMGSLYRDAADSTLYGRVELTGAGIRNGSRMRYMTNRDAEQAMAALKVGRFPALMGR